MPALSPALRLFCRGSRSGLVWKLLCPTSLRGNSTQSVNSKLGHSQEKTTLNEPGLWTSCTRCRGGEESRYRTLQMHRHIDLLGDETRPCVLQLSHRVEVKSSRLRSSNIKIVAELLFINWKVFSLGYTLAQDGGVLTLCWMTDQSGFFLELLDTVVPELAVQETLPPERTRLRLGCGPRKRIGGCHR